MSTSVAEPRQTSPPFPSAGDLARYSVALGMRGLFYRGGSEAFWRAWMPLDVERVVELPWAVARVLETQAENVLDLASPKLLACWLAEHTGANVVATDIWETEIARWKALVAAADRRRRRFGRLVLEPADATELRYRDSSFDAAVSVSVIEHIPGDGDAAAMREAARVLRPGGTLVLTLPYGLTAEDVHVEHDLYGQRYEGQPLFFYRRYSAEAVQFRLLSGGDFEVAERSYWTKSGVQSAQAELHRRTPPRWELGKALGPLLVAIGHRALTAGSPEAPAAEGVLGLVLRRRGA